MVRSIPVGSDPVAVAYDSGNRYLYVANDILSYGVNSNLTVVNGSANTPIASIPVGWNPLAVAYDNGNGYLYVANCQSNNLSVIDGATNQAVNSIGLTSFYISCPDAVAYDSTNGYVYVANSGSNNVTVIDVADGWFKLVGVGPAPVGIAYDHANGDIYVANAAYRQLSGSVTVIDGTTNKVVGSIPSGTEPSAVAYDPENRYVYVTNFGSNNLTVIDGTTNTVVGSIEVGSNPDGVAYDGAIGNLYVANYGSGNVTCVDGATDKVLGSVNVGSGPIGVAYDDSNQDIYVSNSGSDSVSVLVPPSGYPVTFAETGLPSGTLWFVNLTDGASYRSTTNVLTFNESNGTYGYAVSGLPGYVRNPSSGILSVGGTPVHINVRFAVPTYPVIFSETGLSGGISWSATLNGNTNASTGNAIRFLEPNGSGYGFQVGAVPGYSASPSSGTITVAGTSVAKSIDFTAMPGPLSVSAWGKHTASGGNGTACQNPNGTVTSKGGNWALWTFTAVAQNGTPPYNFSWTFPHQPTPVYGAEVVRNFTSAYETPYPPPTVVVGVRDSAGTVYSSTLSFPPPPGAPAIIPPCPISPSKILGFPLIEGYALIAGLAVAVVAAAASVVIWRIRRSNPPGR
ncbi:MAG TPA: YncE family protein [Thermoplasmata archaeon]|nr:YncE family protein [Thermoplasmata archaeon]